MSFPLTRADIEAASARIAPYVRATPLLEADTQISFKLEFLQHAGSFKTRGAFNSLLSRKVPPAGVTAASGGNHGAAVAYAARSLGYAARIFVPEISSPAKQAKIRSYGAEVIVQGAAYQDARMLCEAYANESGALNVEAFEAVETIAGQGTVAREWERQLTQAGHAPLDTILIAVGGGGLIAGVAAWFAGRAKIVGVEPEGSRALHAALEAGAPVDVPVKSVAADSLGARRAGTLAFAISREAVDHVALVSDTAIIAAQKTLWNDWRMALEPGGAAAYAAVLSGAYKPAKGERVGVLLCGANVDLGALSEIV